MRNFIYFMNKVTDDFILKGGTSLLLCYKLDRFSEDIDLNGFDGGLQFFKIVETFSKKYGYSFRIAKDTDTVKRVLIDYGSSEKKLKIEVSYRNGIDKSKENYTIINGIVVYTIPAILSMKLNAYNHRDKIRDLYDIVFIYNTYLGMLDDVRIELLRDAIAYKGCEQVLYLIENQSDTLINQDKLFDDFLKMYENLGL